MTHFVIISLKKSNIKGSLHLFSHNWPKNNPFEVNENSHLLGKISIFIIKISWFLSFHWLEDFYCDKLEHLITISSQSAYHCRWVLSHWSLSSSITSHSFTSIQFSTAWSYLETIQICLCKVLATFKTKKQEICNSLTFHDNTAVSSSCPSYLCLIKPFTP